MPVNSPHPLYVKNEYLWTKCRDVYEGEEAVKARGSIYLPFLTGSSEGEYDSYRMRAMFYGATHRTVQGLTGAVMRRPPEIKGVDSKFTSMLKSIGEGGVSFTEVLNKAVEEVITVGRVGVLVDSHRDGTPYAAVYYAENILNWRYGVVKGVRQPILIVLKEIAENLGDDEFDVQQEEKFRVLKLVRTEDGDFTYVVEIYTKVPQVEDNEPDEWQLSETIIPKFSGGRTIEFIPFVMATPSGITDEIEKPPILDLANVNLSHYRNSADLEHGRHFTALPTAWVAGFNPSDNLLKIGSTTAWVAQDPGAKAGFLEFTGAGLKSLAEAMSSKESLMAVLGARLLEEQKKAAEAAEAVRLRHTSEQSALTKISMSVSDLGTIVLKWLLLWKSSTLPSEEVSVLLNRDFNIIEIDPNKMVALIQLFQAGLASWSTIFYNLKRGEMVPDGVDEDTEFDKIQSQYPMTVQLIRENLPEPTPESPPQPEPQAV